MGVLAVRAHEVFLGAPPHLARSLAGKTPRFLAEVEDSNPVNTAAAISGSVSPLIAVSACHRACIHQVAVYATDRGGSEVFAHLSVNVCTSLKKGSGILRITFE